MIIDGHQHIVDDYRSWGGAFALLFGVALVIAGSGCASTRAREQPEYQKAPAPYPATRMNFGDPDWPVEGGGRLDFSGPCSCMIFPVDFPVSFVTDTLLLPMDLFRASRASRNKKYVSNALYSAKMPSAEEFKKRYMPVYSLDVVWRYVEGPPEQISQERLDMLLDAGVSVSLLASSRRIPEKFADRLVDRSLAGVDSTRSLESLAQNQNAPAATLRRLASLNNTSLLPYLAGNERTPPDVLYRLADNAQCVAGLVQNKSTSPEVLLKLVTKYPEHLGYIVRHPNANPEVFLAALRATNAIPERLIPISGHLNATPEVLKLYAETCLRTLTNKPPPSLDEFRACDTALTQLAQRRQLPPELLQMLATQPFPRMLDQLANRKDATTNVLATILMTCRQTPPFEAERTSFASTYDDVRRRLGLHLSTDEVLARMPTANENTLRDMIDEDGITPEALLAIARSTNTSPTLLWKIAEHRNATPEICRAVAAVCSLALTNATLPTTKRQEYQNVLWGMSSRASCPTDVLLKLTVASSPPASLRETVEHRNATPEIYRAVAAVCIPALTNTMFTTEKRQEYEEVLWKMANRTNCTADVLCRLAVAPSPSVLIGVVNNPQATSNILAAVLASCQKAQTQQGASPEYEDALSIARQRLGLPTTTADIERGQRMERERLEQDLKQSPESTSYWEQLIRLDLSEDRRDEAEAHLKKLLAVDSRNLKGNQLMGAIELERKRYAGAATYFRTAVEIERSPDDLNNLAWTLQMQGAYDQALALSRESVQANPKIYNSRDTLGVILMKSGQLDEAEKELAAARKLNPNAPEVQLHLAQLCVRKGALQEALEWSKDLESRASELSAADQEELRELLKQLRKTQR